MKYETVAGFVLIMLVLVSVFPFIVPSAVALSPVDWWPMFHHDVLHNGYSTTKTPINNVTLWSYATGWPVLSSPAVVNNVVYVGSCDNNTYAFNATNGVRLWNYTTGSLVLSSPAVANGMVFIGSGDNKTYALDAATGALIGTYTTGGSVGSSPAVVNSLVYVGSNDGKIYAFGREVSAAICTNDGKNIKNGAFWDWIKGNFTSYKDMIFVFGECFGGGFVNSLPTTDLPNTVAMSASAENEPAWGSHDSGHFLQGLVDASKANPTNTVDQIFSDAGNRDIANPNSPYFWGLKDQEHPQISPSSGNNMKFHDGQSNYAIMFAGILTTGSSNWNNLARMYNFMVKPMAQGGLGYSPADITVLYGDGTGRMPNGTWSSVPVSVSATVANLQLEIKSIAAQMNPDSTLLFWVSDHGDIDQNILGVKAAVGAQETYQFQFDLDPAYIQATSLSDPPFVEIAHQGVTGDQDTVTINNVTVGSLDPTSDTTTLYFDQNAVAFNQFGNIFTIVSGQNTNFTISSITLSSGPVSEQFTPVPEFPSPFILALFMTAILLAATIVRKRKKQNSARPLFFYS